MPRGSFFPFRGAVLVWPIIRGNVAPLPKAKAIGSARYGHISQRWVCPIVWERFEMKICSLIFAVLRRGYKFFGHTLPGGVGALCSVLTFVGVAYMD